MTRQRPEPDPLAAAIVDALAHAAQARAPELPPGVPDLAAAEARLSAGVPGLTGERLLDGGELIANAERVASALDATEAAMEAGAVAQALAGQAPRLDLETLAAAALAGAWEELASLARALGVDADALTTVLDHAARPALRAGAARLRTLLSDLAWERGFCPACGAAAALGTVGGKERERRLYCGRCATGWRFPRVRCPGCGERNHERLGMLHAPGESEYRRAELCDGCHRYIKTVALLDEPDAGRLLRLDLETAALDFVALDHGYRRLALT